MGDGQRVNILDVPVSAITMADAVAAIENWVARRERRYVCVTGVHGVMECSRDPALLAIHRAAGLVTPDGMPLVWMARRLGHPCTERVYGPDLMQAMLARSARHGYRNYLFGGHPRTAARLEEVLIARYPGLRIVGRHSPPFRPATAEEDAAAVELINAARPDIVWIGLGTPKQERWMAAHVGRLSAPVLVGVGAAFDFLAGEKRQAPLWMQRNGLEWMFRFATEPRRLAGRYCRNNPSFLLRAAWQLGATRLRSRSLPHDGLAS